MPEPVVSDDELLLLSERNEGYKIERNDDGRITMSPSHSAAGPKNVEAVFQLKIFEKKAGGKTFDAASGFKTPRGGVFAPDASWMSRERLANLTEEQNRATGGRLRMS